MKRRATWSPILVSMVLASSPMLSACSVFETLFPTDLRRKTAPSVSKDGGDGPSDRDESASDLDPPGADETGDGPPDGDDGEGQEDLADDDHDGLTNEWEAKLGFDPANGDSGSAIHGADLAANGIGDCAEDVDGDGAPNCWEISHGFDPQDPADLTLDWDADGFSNAEEYPDFDPKDGASHPGPSPLLVISDADLTVTGRTNQTNVFGTLRVCLPGDLIIFTADGTVPEPGDTRFGPCTTDPNALATTLASTTEGEQSVFVWRKNSNGVVQSPVTGHVIFDVTGPTGSLAFANQSADSLTIAITPPSESDTSSVIMRHFTESDCSGRGVADGADVALTLSTTSIVDGSLSFLTPHCYKAFWTDDLGNVGTAVVGQTDDDDGPAGTISITGQSSLSLTVGIVHPTDFDVVSFELMRYESTNCASSALVDGTSVSAAPSDTSIADGGLSTSKAYCYKAFWTDVFGNVGTAHTTQPYLGVGPAGSVTIAGQSALKLTVGITKPSDPNTASIILRRYTETDCSARTDTEGSSVTVTLSSTSVADGGLSLDTPYCYKAFWRDTFGNSGTAYTAVPYDGVGPSGTLTLAARTNSSLSLTHSPPGDADYASVILRRITGATCDDAGKDDGAAVSMTKSATSVVDTGLASATPYCYKIFWYDAFGNSSTTSPAAGDTPSVTTGQITCDRSDPDDGHVYYYEGSTVSLVYACDKTVGPITTSLSMPAYLSSAGSPSVSGSNVTFSGTAASPSAGWSFAVDNVETHGDATAISTQILPASSLISSLTPPETFDPSNTAGTTHNSALRSAAVYDFGHKLALSSSWDGDPANVTFSTSTITTDLHGVLLYASCDAAPAAGPYVCNGTATTVAGPPVEMSNDLRLKWKWGAFDQGRYYVDLSPRAVIEGGTINMPTKSLTFTVPMQTGGQVMIGLSGADGDHDQSTLSGVTFPYGVAFSSEGTAVQPVLGMIYYTDISTVSATYFRRVTFARDQDPTQSMNVTQLTDVSLAPGANTQNFAIHSLSDTTADGLANWATLGTRANSGKSELLFNRIVDSASAPTLVGGASLALMDFSVTNFSVVSVDSTDPFGDSATNTGVARIGFAYVRKDVVSVPSTSVLIIGKLNPLGATFDSVIDDKNFSTVDDDDDNQNVVVTPAAGVAIDRVRIKYVNEPWGLGDDSGYFYIAYRQATDLKLIKTQSRYDVANATYGTSLALTVKTSAFNSGATNSETLDLAVAPNGGSPIVGVVWRDKENANGNATDCFFQKVSSSMATVGSAIRLSAGKPCRYPSIHHVASGRFVVTFAEDNGATWDIKYVEINPVSNSVTHAATTVVQGLANPLIKLATRYSSVADWMAVFYREALDPSDMILHGFHVSDK